MNYEREIKGQTTLPTNIHRLFLGSPGTGKTTCAEIYGKILKELRFLSSGELVKTTASDFVAEYIGQSSNKTLQILKKSRGKVLLIDEAYNLNSSTFGRQVSFTVSNVIFHNSGYLGT